MKAGEILRAVGGTAISVLLCALAAFAQQNAPSSAAPAKGAPAVKKRAQKKTATSTTSSPKDSSASQDAAASSVADKGGKNRDPFRTLIPEKKATESAIPLRLPPGKKGLVIEQLELQGIARSLDGGWIAVVDNKTRRAYFLREKDELFNGVVSKVLPDRIVFEEINTDAMGKKTTREVVRKMSGDTDQ